MILVAGQIVIVHWRDAMPKEANKTRPAIVVEDSALFEPSYPNAIVVPLSLRTDMVVPEITIVIPPTTRNGLTAPSHALCQLVTAVSKRRITPTEGRVTTRELGDMRRAIALAIGVDESP